MHWSRTRVAIGSLIVAGLLIVLAVALVIGTGGSSGKTAASPATSVSDTTPADEIAPADAGHYAALFASLEVGKTTIGILKKWPKPYQDYHDQFGEHCYEWKAARLLYDLCFKKNVLALKDPGDGPFRARRITFAVVPCGCCSMRRSDTGLDQESRFQ